jgi:hypothetical protein
LRAQHADFKATLRKHSLPLFPNDEGRALWNKFLDVHDWYPTPMDEIATIQASFDALHALIRWADQHSRAALELAKTCIDAGARGSSHRDTMAALSILMRRNDFNQGPGLAAGQDELFATLSGQMDQLLLEEPTPLPAFPIIVPEGLAVSDGDYDRSVESIKVRSALIDRMQIQIKEALNYRSAGHYDHALPSTRH